MPKLHVGHFAAYLAVRCVVCVAQAVSLDTAQRIARWLAWLFAEVLGVRRRVVEENLRYAFPKMNEQQRRALARRMWEHLFLLAIEVAHAPRKIHETNWRTHVRLRGEDELLRLVFSDRPVVIVTGHFGNFEVGGFVMGLLGVRLHTIARPLDNPYLDRFVNRFRCATGQQIIAKLGASNQLLEVMAGGGVITLLADQAAGPKGCWVDFFGRPASTYKAIALLSLANDAPLVVSCVRRLGRPLQFELWACDMVDPSRSGQRWDVRSLTEWYTERLEHLIRQSPEQYWWVHRRWKGQPQATRARRRQAA